MQITVLAGGVGGARFVRGLLSHLRTRDDADQTSVTVVGNTGDDITLVGLRVCPDLDTLLYTLGDGVDEGQGWGRAQESTRVAGELATLGVGPDWFTLTLVAHTQPLIVLPTTAPGDRVNIEADIMAKYAEKILEARR